MDKKRPRNPGPEPFTVSHARRIIDTAQRTGSARLLTRRLNDLRAAVPFYQSLGAAGGATVRERVFAGLARSHPEEALRYGLGRETT